MAAPAGYSVKVPHIAVEAGVIVKGFQQCETAEQTIQHITQAFQQASDEYKVGGIIYPVGTKTDRAVVKFNNASVANKLIDFGELMTREKRKLIFEKIKLTSGAHNVYYIRVDPDVANQLSRIISNLVHEEGIKYLVQDDEHCFISDSRENVQMVVDTIKTELTNIADQDRGQLSISPTSNASDDVSDCESFEDIYLAETTSTVASSDEEGRKQSLKIKSENDIPVKGQKLNIPKIKEGYLLKVRLHHLSSEITTFLKRHWKDNVIIVKDDKFIVDFNYEHILIKLTEEVTSQLIQKYMCVEPEQQVMDRNPTTMSAEPDVNSDSYLMISHGDAKESAKDRVSNESATDAQCEHTGNDYKNDKTPDQRKQLSNTNSKTSNGQGKKRKSTEIGRKDAQEKDNDTNREDDEDGQSEQVTTKRPKNVDAAKCIGVKDNQEDGIQPENDILTTENTESRRDKKDGQNCGKDTDDKVNVDVHDRQKNQSTLEAEKQRGIQGGPGQKNILDDIAIQSEIDKKGKQGDDSEQDTEDRRDKGNLQGNINNMENQRGREGKGQHANHSDDASKSSDNIQDKNEIDGSQGQDMGKSRNVQRSIQNDKAIRGDTDGKDEQEDGLHTKHKENKVIGQSNAEDDERKLDENIKQKENQRKRTEDESGKMNFQHKQDNPMEKDEKRRQGDDQVQHAVHTESSKTKEHDENEGQKEDRAGKNQCNVPDNNAIQRDSDAKVDQSQRKTESGNNKGHQANQRQLEENEGQKGDSAGKSQWNIQRHSDEKVDQSKTKTEKGNNKGHQANQRFKPGDSHDHSISQADSVKKDKDKCTKQEQQVIKDKAPNTDSQNYQMSHKDDSPGKNEKKDIDGRPKHKTEDRRSGFLTVHSEIYQFLKMYHEKDLMKIERSYNVTIRWLNDETERNLGILAPANGNKEKRNLAENEFIKLYQDVYNSVQLQKVAVEKYKSSDIKQCVRKTMKEIKNMLLLYKDSCVFFIGKESDVTRAKKYFKKSLGIPIEERRLKLSNEPEKLSESSSDQSDFEITVGSGIKIIIRRSDITREDVDVIVNAANGKLEHGGGVAKAIAVKAGRQIDAEGKQKIRERGRFLDVSEVLDTRGYDLKAKYVVHAVGPIHGQHRHFRALLEKTFSNCLEYADGKLEATSVSIPLISSGTYGGGKRECAKALAASICDYVEVKKSRNLKEIRLVNIDAEATEEIKCQISAVSWYTPHLQSTEDAENINSESEQSFSTQLNQKAEIQLSHAVLVEGFGIYKTHGETKFNLALILHKHKNGGGEIERIIYPVGKCTKKAIVIFSELKVAKYLIGIGASSESNRSLQIKPIEIGHHNEAITLDMNAILPIGSGVMKFPNRIQTKCCDLGDGKLLLEDQHCADQAENFVNDELLKWLSSHVDLDEQRKKKEPISVNQCVIVTGFTECASNETTSDKVELILQRQKFGGGDVKKVIYPFGNSTRKAVAIFHEEKVASSLIKATKISDKKGQDLKIHPFKVGQQMKTFILELGEVALLIDPTLKHYILETVRGICLENGRLMLEDGEDVQKIYKLVTDKVQRSLNSYLVETAETANGDLKVYSDENPQAGSEVSSQTSQFLIYQFLTTCFRDMVNKLEKNYDVAVTWMPDENNFVVQSNRPGDDTNRKNAEYIFRSMYQNIQPVIKQLQVTDVYAAKNQRAVQETSRKYTDVFILPKELVFVGNEGKVQQAMEYFKGLCGVNTVERRAQQYDSLNLVDVNIVLEGGIKVIIRHGDITIENVDVIVNAANGKLQHGSGVARAIAEKAGRQIDDEGQWKLQERRADLDVSDVLHTHGYNLTAKYVIHAVGPRRKKGDGNEYFWHRLERTFMNCLEYADGNLKAGSIAIPLISSGVFGGDKEGCARSLYNSIQAFQKRKRPNIKEIHLVNIDVEATSAIQDMFKKYWQHSDQESQASQLRSTTYGTTPTNDEAYHHRQQNTLRGATGTSDPSYDEQNKRNDRQEHSKSRSIPAVSKTKGATTHKWKPVAAKEEERCPICMEVLVEPIKKLSCGHTFCRDCIDTALKYKPVCPNCGKVFGVLKGNQPPGRMTSITMPKSLPGYGRVGCIKISYDILSGIQTDGHPNPGQPYHGTSRNAYLPDNSEGRLVAQLLRKAFDAKLIFTVGTSITSGIPNAVIWNDIHHKTSMSGEPYGYPDSTYLKRVREELAAKGIK